MDATINAEDTAAFHKHGLVFIDKQSGATS
jgi:hypothetical protein